jgi:hypothetical protein
MHYVIIRDDDTNALTPVDCLEQLYRPFLERGLPVNLAAIPAVATDARMQDGRPEGFLLKKESASARTLPIGSNRKLVRYLLENPGYHIIQHGCHHDALEFDRPSHAELSQRLEQGTHLLLEAGFPRPQTFVAPYDKLSRAGLEEVAARFRILSTGWYELRRLPYAWWPNYAFKKLRHAPHWRVGHTLLLSHPGCLLSYQRTYSTMLGGILHYLKAQQLTVLVTHWWEYFRDDSPDEAFIDFLHETAFYLATHPELKVISFSDLLSNRIRLN